MQNQNYKEAFDLVEQVLRIVPDDITALTLKGQLLGTAGRFAEAMAIVEQILQNDSENALAWSMRAVLLSNMGQQQAALSAIERSLEIDASNPESYSIKTHIMENIATQQTHRGEHTTGVVPQQVPSRANLMATETGSLATKDNPRAFFMETGLQILGFILGVAGAASTYFLRETAIPFLNLAIACLGLATMCVIATRGAFRYGFSRLVPTVLLTVLSAALLGGIFVVLRLTGIVANIQAQTQITAQAAIVRLFAFGFIGVWLAAAAILPLLGAIIGLIAGFIGRLTRGSK
jgi:tetratricopeptide (TPR) repeat protein